MPELKSLQTIPVQEIQNPRFRKSGKRWKEARTVSNARNKDINFMVELYYKEILDLAKKLICTLPDTYSRTVYEKDEREDNSESFLAMHTFISPSFYWHLECDLAYFYRAEFDFHNCPLKQRSERRSQKW